MSWASSTPLQMRLPFPNDFGSVASVTVSPHQGSFRLTPAHHWGLDGLVSVPPFSSHSIPALAPLELFVHVLGKSPRKASLGSLSPELGSLEKSNYPRISKVALSNMVATSHMCLLSP